MKFFEIAHIIDNPEWEEKISDLAQRCKKLNGMSEQALLQLAVTRMPMYHVWLMYLEDLVIDLEQSEKQKSFFDKLFKKEDKDVCLK